MKKPPRHRNNSSNNNNNNAKAGIGTARHHHQQPQQQHPSSSSSPAAAAAASPAIAANNSFGSAPSSVMCVPASPLTRELSDLSGSYMNGNTNPRGMIRPAHSHSVCSSTTQTPTEDVVQGFWRQAHLLSVNPPREQQLIATPSSSLVMGTAAASGGATPSSALIVVERNGVVELVKKNDSEDGCSSTNGDDDDNDNNNPDQNNEQRRQQQQQQQQQQQHPLQGSILRRHLDNSIINTDDASAQRLFMLPAHAQHELATTTTTTNNNTDDELSASAQQGALSRIPILILLLDAGRKQYELMQLWVAPQTDLVRDVLHTLQRKLSDKWRQDYDGLFQLRGDKYCQLVHILSIAKYDVRPRELWVAKPWSMAAKPATELATDCIRQLRAVGLLSLYTNNSSSAVGKSRIKNFFSKAGASGRTSPTFLEEEAPLTLSDDALKRLYVPNGIMKHHHACQFLSFRPPAIPSRVSGRPYQPHYYANYHHNNHHHGHNRSGFLGSLLGTAAGPPHAASFDDVSSQLSNPSDAMLLPSSLADDNASSSAASSPNYNSPGRKQHHQSSTRGGHHQHYSSSRFQPSYDLNSSLQGDLGWKPTGPLEVVGEVIVSNNNNNSGSNNNNSNNNDMEESNGQEVPVDMANNTSNISLADLESSSSKKIDLKVQQEEERTERRSLLKLLAPLNCAKCRSNGRAGSKKGDDYYSSSRGGGGDGGSGSGTESNNNHIINDNNGRETPTSKGSGEGEGDDTGVVPNDVVLVPWGGPSNKGQEDGSIVSESAPLLTSMLGSSSSACSATTPQFQQELRQGLHVQQQRLVQSQQILRPTVYSRGVKFEVSRG